MKLIAILLIVWSAPEVFSQSDEKANFSCRTQTKNYFMCEGNVLNQTSDGNSEFHLQNIDGDYNRNSSRLILRLIITDGFIKVLPSNLRDFFPYINHLGVVNTQLKSIRRDNFATLKLLKSLDLRKNQIEAIPNDVFLDLTILRKIDLSENSLTALSDAAFTTLSYLNKFICNGNLITRFDSQTFRRNAELEEIHLWSNKIESIRFDFKMFPRMKILDFRDNTCISNLFYLPSPDSRVVIEVQSEIEAKCSNQGKEEVFEQTCSDYRSQK